MDPETRSDPAGRARRLALVGGSPPSGARPGRHADPPGQPVPAQLDALHHELLARANEAMATQERLRGLLDAVIGVAGDLSLPVVLRRIVESACVLVDARYGALGVLGPDRQMSAFHYVGMDEQARERIGHLPEGKGILGLLVSDPRPLRLRELSRHPRSAGFPPGHPPMHSFLGVPIRVRGEVYGNLYLTEKLGAEEFTREDEDLVAALAAAAAVAIENARLYEETRRRQAWLSASAEITTTLLGIADPDQALRLVAERARQITGADLASIVLPATPGRLVIEVVDGLGAGRLAGQTMPADRCLCGAAMRKNRAVVVPDAAADEKAYLPPWRAVDLGPAMVVPLAAAGQTMGALVLGNARGGAPFSELDLDMATSFAGHAAIALEFARIQDDRERLAIFEERDRIARDLHDLVVQQLFATGLSLQGLGRLLSGTQAAKLDEAVEDLDRTIRDIRRTIFALQAAQPETASLRAQLIDVASQAVKSLGFEPHIRLEGPLDRTVPPSLQPHLLATLREALSNVARHADAVEVEVTVRSDGTNLLLIVSDDGRGIGAAVRRSGLANLRRRAEEFGGELSVGPGEDGRGTHLTWRVPLVGARF